MSVPADRGAIEGQINEQRAIVMQTAGATDETSVRKRGHALWKLGQDLLQIGCYDEAAARLGEAAESLWTFTEWRSTAVLARAQQATALEAGGRDQEAFDLMSDLIEEIGLDWNEPESPHVMAFVLAQWVGYLPAMDRAEQVEEVADVILERFPTDSTDWQRLAVGRALRQKAISRVMEGDWGDALALLDELVERCPEEQNDAYRDESLMLLVASLTMRGFVLEQLGRTGEAMGSYDDAIRIGANATDPRV